MALPCLPMQAVCRPSACLTIYGCSFKPDYNILQHLITLYILGPVRFSRRQTSTALFSGFCVPAPRETSAPCYLSKIFIPHMRGSDHLKNILKTNNEAKFILAKSYILYYAIAVLMYGYYKLSLLLFVLLSTLDLLSLGMLHWLTLPTFVSENGAKKLVRVQSLNSSGLVSFFFDLMFWGLLCKVLIIFSKKSALLYFGVLFSLASEFVYKPYKSIKKI